jgi:hypothetical protein
MLQAGYARQRSALGDKPAQVRRGLADRGGRDWLDFDADRLRT